MKATILGAGVMGSSMTLPFCDRGMLVNLVGTHLDRAIIESVKEGNFHPKLSITLPKGITGHHHEAFDSALINDSDFILLGVASAGVDWAIDKLEHALKKPIPIIMITKGMAPFADTLGAFPDVVQQTLESKLGFKVPVAAIGGPCIAGELAVRRPTGTVIVSRDAKLAEQFCNWFEGDYYHPRPSTDMMGVEACAAFKNFYAIAVGWAHGQLDILPEAENKARNNNAAAILFDQAVREMMHLSKALGGTEESVWGMPGTGDLYVTCQAGRNSRLGNNLGRGLTYKQVKEGPMKDDTIEGAELGRSVASSLFAMMDKDKLSRAKMPLMVALLECLANDKPLTLDWTTFHRA